MFRRYTDTVNLQEYHSKAKYSHYQVITPFRKCTASFTNMGFLNNHEIKKNYLNQLVLAFSSVFSSFSCRKCVHLELVLASKRFCIVQYVVVKLWSGAFWEIALLKSLVTSFSQFHLGGVGIRSFGCFLHVF